MMVRNVHCNLWRNGGDDRDTWIRGRRNQGFQGELVTRLVTKARYNLVNDEEMTSEWHTAWLENPSL